MRPAKRSGDEARQLQSRRSWARRVHPEHPAHVSDAGRLKTQQLIENQCVLPSKEMIRNNLTQVGLANEVSACAGLSLESGRTPNIPTM